MANSWQKGTSNGILAAVKELLLYTLPYTEGPDRYKKVMGRGKGLTAVNISGATERPCSGQQRKMWAMRHRRQRTAEGNEHSYCQVSSHSTNTYWVLSGMLEIALGR